MAGPRSGIDPVQLPRFASIVGEGLLITSRIGRVDGESKSNQNGPAIKRFLIVKLAAAVFELADHGHAEGTAIAAGEMEAPLMSLGIVEAQ